MSARNIAEVAKRDQVFGVERECRLEHTSRFIVPAGFEKGLAVHDVAAHVSRLLRQKLLTDENGLLEIADFPIFVRERREIPARILVELFPELVDARRTGH